MQEISQRVRGNATICYFFWIFSFLFFFNRDPEISHSFVKKHAINAILLHSIAFGFLYLIHIFDFLDISLPFDLRLKKIILILGMLTFIGGILLGMYKAQKWEIMNMREVSSLGQGFQDFGKTKTSENIPENISAKLITAHIPFLGLTIYGKNKNIAHIRDISLINFLSSFFILLVYALGHSIVASVLFLWYCIYSVFQSIRLLVSHEISTPNLWKIPGAEQKILLQKSFFEYIKNTIHGDEHFVAFHEIYEKNIQKRILEEQQNEAEISQYPESKKSIFWYYFPLINFIFLFEKKPNKYLFHRRNGIALSFVFCIFCVLFYKNPAVVAMLAFPVFYGIWYESRSAYKMPYLYNLYEIWNALIHHGKKAAKKTQELHKKEVQTSVKYDVTAEEEHKTTEQKTQD